MINVLFSRERPKRRVFRHHTAARLVQVSDSMAFVQEFAQEVGSTATLRQNQDFIEAPPAVKYEASD